MGNGEEEEEEEAAAADSREDISTMARSLSLATTALYFRPWPSPCDDDDDDEENSFSSDTSISPLPAIFCRSLELNSAFAGGLDPNLKLL